MPGDLKSLQIDRAGVPLLLALGAWQLLGPRLNAATQVGMAAREQIVAALREG